MSKSSEILVLTRRNIELKENLAKYLLLLKKKEKMFLNERFLNNEIKVKIIGFTNAVKMPLKNFSRVQTRPFRAPEIILGLLYDDKCDIWAFGCVLFKIFTGFNLFEFSEDFKNDNEEHLQQVISICKRIPKDLIHSSPFKMKYFTGDYKFKKKDKILFRSLEDILIEKYKFTKKTAFNFSEFLNYILKFRPNERKSIDFLLKTEWINDISEKFTTMDVKEYKEIIKNKNFKSSSIISDTILSFSEISKGDDETENLISGLNRKVRQEFKFKELRKIKQNKFFGHSNKNFNQMKKFCDRSFVKNEIFIGFDDGIDIGKMDERELYNQKFDLDDITEDYF